MVTTPFLVEQTLCGIKTEGAYANIATLAATDYIYVENLDLKFDHKGIERGYQYNSLNPLADASGSTLVNISFETEYQISGSAGNPVVVTPYGALEQAAGLFQNSTQYICEQTASTGFPSVGKSATIYVYYRDKAYGIKGVYGNIEETHTSDGLVKLKFTGQGLYATESLASSVPSPTFKENYVKVASASLSTHAYTPEWSEVVVNYGNELQAVPYAGDVYGFSKVLIVRRKPTIKMKVLMDSKSGHDFIGRRIDKTQGAITYAAGTVPGKMTYSFPTTQYREVDIADENGIYILNVTANVVGNFTKTLS